MFHVYILRCSDGALYVGSSEDLDTRIATHKSGSAALFTRRRRPVVIVYSEAHPTRTSAVSGERQIKRWTRAKKEALVAGDRLLLKRL